MALTNSYREKTDYSLNEAYVSRYRSSGRENGSGGSSLSGEGYTYRAGGQQKPLLSGGVSTGPTVEERGVVDERGCGRSA